MARKKRRSQLNAIDEINMTPLIDLTFLLLIIFMITTPLMENAVDVSPPEMDAEDLPEENNRTVNLDKDGNIVFEKQMMNKSSLLSKLKMIHGTNQKVNLFVRADGDRPYRQVMNLMKTVKSAGFKNVFLVTRAE